VSWLTCSFDVQGHSGAVRVIRLGIGVHVMEVESKEHRCSALRDSPALHRASNGLTVILIIVVGAMGRALVVQRQLSHAGIGTPSPKESVEVNYYAAPVGNELHLAKACEQTLPDYLVGPLDKY
jgi:hypothetical protein